MHRIQIDGHINFLEYNDRFSPLSMGHTAPYEIKEIFCHHADGIAMLIFSSFESAEKAVDALVEKMWAFTPPTNEMEKTKILSIILTVINKCLCSQSILVAPNHILRKNNLIQQDDTITIVSSICEKDYGCHLSTSIQYEIKLSSLRSHFATHFRPHHVTILVNMLLSRYSNSFINNKFDSLSGQWTLVKTNDNTFCFHNIVKEESFGIFRNKDKEYLIDEMGTTEIETAFTQRHRMGVVETLHGIFIQCFTSMYPDFEMLSSISIIKHTPDFFMNAISNTSIVELKRITTHIFGIDSEPAHGDSLFYEIFVLAMESLHQLLEKICLRSLPTPKFAHYQAHYDKCFEHEVNLYLNIGKMIAISLHDKWASCPTLLDVNMIKALFIFTKNDLDIEDDASYKKLKKIVGWSKEGSQYLYRYMINDIASICLKKMTIERRKKIAEILFLLFPNILYEHSFTKMITSKEEQIITKKVITAILLHDKDILIKDHEIVILVMERLIDKHKFGNPRKVISFLKKRNFNNDKLVDEILKETKKHIIKAIDDIYNTFIEPLFLIAWNTYFYSKMQYTSLGNKKNSESHQLHAYISMVGKYDNYFDAIDLKHLPYLLKELKYEEGILDVLGDPFDTKVISKLEETISGFHAYESLSKGDIETIIISTDALPIVQQKRAWICEYLNNSSAKEREWFFRFSTSIPYVNPNEFVIDVVGSPSLSKSKIVYANSCVNKLMVGLSYHVECDNKKSPHCFFEKLKDVAQVFPNADVRQKAKEFFFKDLHESIYNYRMLLRSQLPETTLNMSSGPLLINDASQSKYN